MIYAGHFSHIISKKLNCTFLKWVIINKQMDICKLADLKYKKKFTEQKESAQECLTIN